MLKSFRRRAVLILVLMLIFIILYFILSDISSILTPVPLDPLSRWKGGSWLGYRMGYYGTLIIVLSMIYSIIKRLKPKQIINLGGIRLWLHLHISLAITGSIMVLIHAGFPLNFRYYDLFKYIRLAQGGVAGLVGFAGLATLIIPFILLSGFIGNYLFKYARGDVKRVFSYWHAIHIILTAFLYLTGIIHLILVSWYGFITL